MCDLMLWPDLCCAECVSTCSFVSCFFCIPHNVEDTIEGSCLPHRVLQRLQKRQKVWILVPIGLRWVCRRRHFTVGQCLGFHAEIDFSVDMGRIQGDMSEPSSDRINIEPQRSCTCSLRVMPQPHK